MLQTHYGGVDVDGSCNSNGSGGVGIFITADLGEGGAVEGLMMLIHRRTGLEVRWARILMDSGCVLVGALLGGSIGSGNAGRSVLYRSCHSRDPEGPGLLVVN